MTASCACGHHRGNHYAGWDAVECDAIGCECPGFTPPAHEPDTVAEEQLEALRRESARLRGAITEALMRADAYMTEVERERVEDVVDPLRTIMPEEDT